MDTTIILFILNAFMGVIMWFMKTTITDLKEGMKEQTRQIDLLKDTSFKKSDFSEFKTDLWLRLDEMKADFRRALENK